jgi:hypothetical protein
MKKTFLVIMLAVSIIPQETFCSGKGRLPQMEDFLRKNAQNIMEETFANSYTHMPQYNSDEYRSAYHALTLRLGAAVFQEFPPLALPDDEKEELKMWLKRIQEIECSGIQREIEDCAKYFLDHEPSKKLKQALVLAQQKQLALEAVMNTSSVPAAPAAAHVRVVPTQAQNYIFPAAAAYNTQLLGTSCSADAVPGASQYMDVD